MSPVLAFVIVFVLLLIALVKFKVSPTVGLIIGSVIFGLAVGIPSTELLSTIPKGFGNMMTSIGLLIIFGAIFGDFLGQSGATEELAKGMVRLFGKKNDLLALNVVGFLLSIPIYFGAAYVMTAPLVTALQKLSRKSMKGYIIALFTGLILTHCCVAPTPGPLAVAGQVGANIGWFIIWGIVITLPASLIVGWIYANFVVKKEDRKALKEGMQEILDDEKLLAPDPNKPSALTAFILLCLPIILVVISSIYSLFVTEGVLYSIISFFGNATIALFLAMLVSGAVLIKYMPGKTVMGFIEEASAGTGAILMVVGAGGSFAAVLSSTTISTDFVAIMSAMNMHPIVLGFMVAFLVRAAVGSATAAALASVAVAGPACIAMGLSPLVAGMAICLGATAGTFPTDGAFWQPNAFHGLDTKECFLCTTIPSIMAGLIGLAVLLLLNVIGAGILPGF